MSESRAEYYRKYRAKKKEQHPDTQSEFTATVLHDVAQQLQQICNNLQHVAQQMQQCVQQMCNNSQHVAQQSTLGTSGVTLSKFSDLEIQGINDSLVVAQQSATNVAQQLRSEKSPKRKRVFPPSSPPSHPPQTPPYSSPLLSPQSQKEKGRENFAISSGELSPDRPDWDDDPEAPLVEGKRGSDRDFATWKEFQWGIEQIREETQSDSLMNAFMDWVEYKRERNVNEFYTRKGLVAEVQRFIRRHFEEFPVAEAVTRAIANNWQGWDHKL